MQDFKKLKIWEKSHQLTLAIYEATRKFPQDELYGLTSQIRRSCASIPANIAEACGRGGRTEFSRFLQVSMGSASELKFHLLLAHDLPFIEDAEYKKLESLAVEMKRKLSSFIMKLRD